MDWRFLLGQPDLGRVVCLGNPDDVLLAALAETASDVVLGPPSNDAEPCDVLVLIHPTRDELARAPKLLVPGGWVYAETRGPLRRRPRRRSVRGVFECVSALRALGFENVEAHWHFPDFAKCMEIVPLADRDAVRFSFRRRRRRFDTRAKVAAARLLAALRVFPHILPAASVIGSLPPPDAQSQR